MISRKNLEKSLLVAILMFSFLTSTSTFSQEASPPSNAVSLDPIDTRSLQAIDKCFQEGEAKDELISEYAGEITDLKERLNTEIETNKTNEEIKNLKDAQLKLKDEEIRIYKEYGDRMKDIADRAIQLEEKAQKRTFWEKLGVVGLAIASVIFAFAHH